MHIYVSCVSQRVDVANSKIVNPSVIAVLLVAGGAAVTKKGPSDRIALIKQQLMAEHRQTWGDVLIPDVLTTANRTMPEFNATAVAVAEETAWQWGFWPLTRISAP